MTTVSLYEPTMPPEIPSKRIGRGQISAETWEKINGVGRYADYRPMEYFRLILRKPLSAADAGPMGDVAAIETITTIDCRAVPIWKNGRNTFDARIVIPEEADREKVHSLKGEWVG